MAWYKPHILCRLFGHQPADYDGSMCNNSHAQNWTGSIVSFCSRKHCRRALTWRTKTPTEVRSMGWKWIPERRDRNGTDRIHYTAHVDETVTDMPGEFALGAGWLPRTNLVDHWLSRWFT